MPCARVSQHLGENAWMELISARRLADAAIVCCFSVVAVAIVIGSVCGPCRS